jgi:hypothetical protein
MMNILDEVDRYDVRGPGSQQSNHPGARVVDATQQLVGVYRKIIWCTGTLVAMFADGTPGSDKSDDTGMVLTFLDNLNQAGGVYLSGDDVAEEWQDYLSASAISLKSQYCTFNVPTTGGGDVSGVVGIAPLGVGVAGGDYIFKDGLGADTLVAFGGCPGINDFDILEAQGSAVLEMTYEGNGQSRGAIVSDTTSNGNGVVVGFVISGFSYHFIRDYAPGGVPARAEHLHRIITWLENIVSAPVGVKTSVAVNELQQNYPNPFNPITTIKYQVKETGPVSLRIYNVAGQLVRTLVDEQVKAGLVKQVQWQGLNDAGQPVSSGVYFSKLVAKNYTQTKKMVLLK